MQESKRSKTNRKTMLPRSIALIVPLVCTLLLLSQTVEAQNTYVITDGTRVLVHTTHATDPEAVLGEAGLELGEDDTYTTQHNQGVSEITVTRAQDRAPEQALPVTQTQTYTEAIPYSTVYYDDPSLPAGTQKLLTAGSDGQALCTVRVTYEAGDVSETTLLSRVVRTHPTAQIVARGTAEAHSDDSALPVVRDGLIYTAEGDVLHYTDTVQVRATAYSCEDYTEPGITYTGTEPRVGEIAVDPKVIPLGTRVFVVSNDGQYVYGVATAEDIGGGIKGNRIDLYFDTIAECFQFGDRACTVYILSE